MEPLRHRLGFDVIVYVIEVGQALRGPQWNRVGLKLNDQIRTAVAKL